MSTRNELVTELRASLISQVETVKLGMSMIKDQIVSENNIEKTLGITGRTDCNERIDHIIEELDNLINDLRN